MDPNLQVSSLPGIGKYFAFKLKKLEVCTVEDLIYHFPFRYDDFSNIQDIRNVNEGEKLSIQGIIWQIKSLRSKTGKFLTKATIADQSGTIEAIWFNQPYLTKTLKAGLQVSLSGKVNLNGPKPQLISPSYEILRSNQLPTIHTGRLVPVYPETEGLSSKWIRSKIAKILPQYLIKQQDFLPEEIKTEHKLINLDSALNKIHFPKNYDELETAKKRLSFDELFLIQLASQLRKIDWQTKRKAPRMKVDKQKVRKLLDSLPYELTEAQKRAKDQILLDLTKQIPANRLLEGDVGSGKTVVAATAAYVAFLNGYGSIIAAPTEILAFQHQKTLNEILSPYGLEIGIWTKSKKSKGDVVVGTHALLNAFESTKELGLVVVDEQHRFGVSQRAKLFITKNKVLTPHLLTMTATPIPRTLALSLYGDLDLSVLDEMPTGRQRISTHVVPSRKRKSAYKFIEEQVKNGRQAFIITPFVEPSETLVGIKAAKEEFYKLNTIFSKKTKLGLLHGRLKSKEKEVIIGKFKDDKIDILVSTPVVEVGIDIPNATIMMIESADRFGLAQLHQLRGRVGRGVHKSYCLLFTDSLSVNSLKRLKSMEKIYVGFELAEIDLKMRGPGQIFGTKQSGFINLKLADITEHSLVSATQVEAKKLINKDPSLSRYSSLLKKINNMQSEFVQPN